MIILHDPQCADFGSALRPEQPRRATLSATLLRTAHPEWEWRIPAIATEEVLLTVHTRAHLARLQRPPDFDDDTPYFEGIYDHARRAVGAAVVSIAAILLFLATEPNARYLYPALPLLYVPLAALLKPLKVKF